jgi:hypothetical protein
MSNTVMLWRSMAGGILSILAGTVHLIGWFGLALVLSHQVHGYSFLGQGILKSTSVWIFVSPFMIAAAIAIIGGIFALLRKNWGLAMTGAICSIFSPLTWFVGAAATVFVVIARPEFSDRATQNKPN